MSGLGSTIVGPADCDAVPADAFSLPAVCNEKIIFGGIRCVIVVAGLCVGIVLAVEGEPALESSEYQPMPS